MDGEAGAWFDRELAGCSLADERLNKRLRKLVPQIGSAMGESIPLVCQAWANTKAAYRFFSNDRVSEAEILGGHWLPPMVPSLCSMTQRSSPSKRKHERDRDHQRHKQRARQGRPRSAAS